MPDKNPIITVVGSTHMDFVVVADHIPRTGETVMGSSFKMTPGGKGANQAVAAALLGAKSYLVSCLGEDHIGDLLLENARKKGVSTDYVVRDPATYTGVALIIIDKEGRNVIAVAPGADHMLATEDIDRASEVMAKSDVILLQLEIPLEIVSYVIRKASQFKKVKTILNPAPARVLPGDVLKNVYVLTPNEVEAELLSGLSVANVNDAERAGKRIIKKGVTSVVITLGEKGSFVVTQKESKLVPAIKVKPVDTTGAGDAFNAGLAFALAEGKEIEEAARFANFVAALKITKLGAQEGLPSRAEVEDFIAKIERS